jgi:ATP-dependent DNA ligase
MREAERRHLDRGPVIIKSMHGYPHHAYGIRYVEHAEGHGDKMFAAVCQLGLEGIVSKKLDAPYKSGPSKVWLKIKNPRAPAATRAVDGTF